jgi:hypothetical protein
VAAAVLATTSCSSDGTSGDASSTAADQTTSAPRTTTDPALDEACSATIVDAQLTTSAEVPSYLTLLEQRVVLLTSIAAVADEEGAAAATNIAESFQEAVNAGDPQIAQDPSVFAAESTLGAWAAANCGFTRIDLVGTEHEYTGMPQTVDAGKFSFSLTNEGEEFHMAFIVPVNPDYTGTFEDFAAQPILDIMMQSGGGTFAGAHTMPGETGYLTADLAPGRYAVLCPTLGEEGDTPAHYLEGMVRELTVT